MKRQIEFTLRNPNGLTGTFWMGMGVDGAIPDDTRAVVDAALVQGGSLYMREMVKESGLVVVHVRGPFDVPDGETGGGDGR